jgi:multidrug efflux pump subunit AcrB
MKGLIQFSLRNWHAVIVMTLTIAILGVLMLQAIPIDILPAFKSPAVQVLTFYNGMPAANVAADITNRMERWTGQVSGTIRQESRSIVGASIIRNYFRDDVDPNGALTQCNSLASAAIPNLPPGTLPPVILPFDPTGTVPICLVALNSETEPESMLYDAGRYEVRNMIMAIPGAVAPVVYGGKLRAVMAYLDRAKMQARNLSPLDVMKALDSYNVFLPTGDAKFGNTDYAIDSNSMYKIIELMGDIPIKTGEDGRTVFLKDVATPKDANFIQTNVVRVNGRRQVYIPVYRQAGTSTLDIVEALKKELPHMKAKLSHNDIDLELVMDQSVYVRSSIAALVQEGVLGAILCSLVILLFLGQWRMTMIAVITLPLSVLAACVCLYYTGNTINVMTLAGLTLAIGPMIDSAIICLENTHRYLSLGMKPKSAALQGASEVAMPELVSTLCTFLVLSPLALMPGMGKFLFLPMTLAVMFSMTMAYFLSRTLVPSFSYLFLSSHDAEHAAHVGPIGRLFQRWERLIDKGIDLYTRSLDTILRNKVKTIAIGYGLLVVVLVVFVPIMRREFFPEVDAGAFEIAVRARPGLRIEETEKRIAEVEKVLKEKLGEDLRLLVCEIGEVADWSAAYTPNAGPMDTVVKVQLEQERHHSAQEYVAMLRQSFADNQEFSDLEFSFDAGGMVRGAMNEGKSTPINIRITGKKLERSHHLAESIQEDVKKIDGVVDCRIMQRLNYPEFMVDVDRAKSAQMGLTQMEVMRNVVAALNSSIQFNKRNFWIDPVTHNQYFVGVQYPEENIDSLETLLDVPITGPSQRDPIPLRNIVTITRTEVPAEETHTTLQPTIDLTMGVEGRDLGHVADDVAAVLSGYGIQEEDGVWRPYDPAASVKDKDHVLKGSKIVLTGEYERMRFTFKNLAVGLVLASLLIYFLMVGLDRSFIVPLSVMLVVPLCLAGVLPVLYFTGSAINIQSLLGIIFIVGIKVANTVLMTDFAQELRRHEGLTPAQAIRKAASMRVRPVTMTALAALFAMIPTAMSLERGSEANAPLARAIIGGLFAGEPATLFVLPALYALLVRGKVDPDEDVEEEHGTHAVAEHNGEAKPHLVPAHGLEASPL